MTQPYMLDTEKGDGPIGSFSRSLKACFQVVTGLLSLGFRCVSCGCDIFWHHEGLSVFFLP